MIQRTHLWRILLFFVVPLVTFIVGLDSTGFCLAKIRYLSDEEKFSSVFNYQNKRTDLLEIASVGRSGNKYIKYESFNEYIKENLNCCEVNPGGVYDIPPSSFLYPIFGGSPSGDVVVINFKVRYLDEKGKQRAEEIQFENVVTNCGKVH